VVALAVLGGAIGIFLALRATRPQPERSIGDLRVAKVIAMELEPVRVQRAWPGHGAARAMRAVDVAAQVAARVQSRPEEIEEGVSVSEGQLLVRLDPTDYQRDVEAAEQRLARLRADRDAVAEIGAIEDQLEAAKEDLEVQKRELARVKEAFESGAANQTDVDQRRAALERARREVAALQQTLDVIPARLASLSAQIASARADLETAREDLARTRVTAPFDGVLQELYVERGQWVGVGADVARVVDLSRIEIPLRVPVAAAQTIRVGDRVELFADTERGATWEGRVARVAPEAEDRTRSLTVFIEIAQDPSESGPDAAFDADPGLLLPGQYLLGRVRASSERERLLVPRRVVDDDRVYVVESQRVEGVRVERAREVPVRVAFHVEGAFPSLDPLETQWAVIERGLQPGDRVIVSNLGELLPGQRIETTERSPDERTAKSPEPTG